MIKDLDIISVSESVSVLISVSTPVSVSGGISRTIESGKPG